MQPDNLYILLIIFLYMILSVSGLFLISVLIFHFTARLKSLKEKSLIRGLLAITPIIIITILPIFLEGKFLQYMIFALFTLVFLVTTEKINKKWIRIVLIVVMAIVLFPKPSGYSGFMSQKGYACTCIGVKQVLSGIDTSNSFCQGISLMCHETNYDPGLTPPTY